MSDWKQIQEYDFIECLTCCRQILADGNYWQDLTGYYCTEKCLIASDEKGCDACGSTENLFGLKYGEALCIECLSEAAK